MNLQDLYNKSVAAKTLLTNFANRERVHLNKPINIMRLAGKVGLPYREVLSVLKDLEAMQLGLVDRSHFLPIKSIREIGLEAIPKTLVANKTQLAPEHRVKVIFQLKGKVCKADIPESVIDAFEKLISA